MKDMGIIVVLLIGGIFWLLSIPEKKKEIKFKNILCVPSGEIISITSYKLSTLKEHGYTKWDKEYKIYKITDKMKKTL